MASLENLMQGILDINRWNEVFSAAGTNQGLLSLVTIWLAFLGLLISVRRLRGIAILIATGSIVACVSFLWPRAGGAPMAAETSTSSRQTSDATFRVTGVPCDDTLNVRSEPGLLIAGTVIGQLTCDAAGIVALGPSTRIGFSHWWLIEGNNQTGWVNARFLELNRTNAAQEFSDQKILNYSVCGFLTAPDYVTEASKRACMLTDLRSEQSDKLFWTGACDSRGFASGAGALRAFDTRNNALDLRFAFIGRMRDGNSLEGAWIEGGQVNPVCSTPDGIKTPISPAERKAAAKSASLGLEQAIDSMDAAGQTGAATFYRGYRDRMATLGE